MVGAACKRLRTTEHFSRGFGCEGKSVRSESKGMHSEDEDVVWRRVQSEERSAVSRG